MNVLLHKDVKGVGKRMEIKNVSDGYARNFLIPRGLAAPADEKSIAQKALWEAHEASVNQKAHEAKKRLSRIALSFSVKAGEHGEVFGSVGKKEIESALHAQGIHDVTVLLKHHIKKLGTHTVPVRLPKGVTAEVQVTLAPEE